MSTRLLVSTARSILILGHQNADPDAVASMVAMMQYCRHLNPECIVKLACSDMSRISSQMLRMFVGDVVVGESVEDEFDLMIIVDTNSRYQLGPQLENLTLDPSRTIVIDHHDRTPDTSALAHNLVIDEGKSSTCEIVLELLENDGVPLDRATASLLLAGLIFDTRRFLYGGIAAIRNALRLVENGADYDMCLRSLIVRLDRSERIARLRAAGRLKLHEIDGWLVVTSNVSAFEASACRAFIDLGADVAIVGSHPERDVVRISSRSTVEFSTETGVSLSQDVMEKIGKLIEGAGGGHSNAAGANGRKNLELALEKSVELIRQAIERNKSKVAIPDGSH